MLWPLAPNPSFNFRFFGKWMTAKRKGIALTPAHSAPLTETVVPEAPARTPVHSAPLTETVVPEAPARTPVHSAPLAKTVVPDSGTAKKMHVLIVDDNDIVRRMKLKQAADIFKGTEDLSIVAVPDAQSAESQLDEWAEDPAPLLVLLDKEFYGNPKEKEISPTAEGEVLAAIAQWREIYGSASVFVASISNRYEASCTVVNVAKNGQPECHHQAGEQQLPDGIDCATVKSKPLNCHPALMAGIDALMTVDVVQDRRRTDRSKSMDTAASTPVGDKQSLRRAHSEPLNVGIKSMTFVIVKSDPDWTNDLKSKLVTSFGQLTALRLLDVTEKNQAKPYFSETPELVLLVEREGTNGLRVFNNPNRLDATENDEPINLDEIRGRALRTLIEEKATSEPTLEWSSPSCS